MSWAWVQIDQAFIRERCSSTKSQGVFFSCVFALRNFHWWSGPVVRTVVCLHTTARSCVWLCVVIFSALWGRGHFGVVLHYRGCLHTARPVVLPYMSSGQKCIGEGRCAKAQHWVVSLPTSFVHSWSSALEPPKAPISLHKSTLQGGDLEL